MTRTPQIQQREESVMTNENPPINQPEDGFSGSIVDGGRMIVGDKLRCDITRSPPWIHADGWPIDLAREWLVLTTREAVQKWSPDNAVIETIIKQKGRTLPAFDELNEAAPKSEWREGPNGMAGPWQWGVFVYLLDSRTAGRATFVGGSTGARIGVNELQDNVSSMKMLRGQTVRPIVRFDLKPMKTKKFGIKQRPYFRPVRWVELNVGASAVPRIEHQSNSGKPALPIGYPNDYAEAKGRVSNLKTVERPSVSEEIEDDIPF
jgi:hypothetical protein